jgi:hypothetical protein
MWSVNCNGTPSEAICMASWYASQADTYLTVLRVRQRQRQTVTQSVLRIKMNIKEY